MYNFEKNFLRCFWLFDGSKIVVGLVDRFVYVWDIISRRILYKLFGYVGFINEVVFYFDEFIIILVLSDKRLYMGEI